MMAAKEHKSLMRNLGEFFGHVVKGVKTPADPKEDSHSTVVKKEVQEQKEGAITYRRTTIDEIEVDPTPGSEIDIKDPPLAD